MDDLYAIKEQVGIYAVLADYHVEFYGGGTPEQIHCPFHYPDTNRSCRVYPDTDSLYCFVCDKTWDVVEFVKDKEELSFGAAVAFVKSRYGVEIFTPDYETNLYRNRQQAPEDVKAFGTTVEQMFISDANRLTDGNLLSILSEYNKCLAQKDDMPVWTVEQLKDWREASLRILANALIGV